MEAKDTVMSGEQMSEAIQIKTKKWSVCNPAFIEDIAGIVAEAQAEISFKAGYNKALAQLADMTEECKQIGRKEVVEWINSQEESRCMDCYTPYTFRMDEWQAKLKEWGIK